MSNKHLIAHVVGSHALEIHLDGQFKANSDIDLIIPDHIINIEGYDCSHYIDLNNAAIVETYSENCLVSLKGLAVMKRSHLWRANLNFSRHITLYHKFILPNLNEDFNNNDLAILKERTALTMQEYPQQGPNLNQSVEDFFNDAVTKIYPHDYLHDLFAFYDKPMYMKMQRDFSKAKVEKDMWDAFSHQEKIRCVAEETYVIAAERFLIPNDWNSPAKLAYMKALEKVCTTLCSGWFRDFAIDNYPEVLLEYDSLKFEKVKQVLKSC